MEEFITVNDMVLKWVSPDSNFIWKRPPVGWELLELGSLNSVMNKLNLSNKQDSLRWEAIKGNFSSASCYELFTSSMGFPGPWATIWSQKVPPKVKFFLWQLSHKILPTMSFLKKRGIQQEELCKMCNTEIEDVDHIFWNCIRAREGWSFLSKWLDVPIVLRGAQFNFETCLRSCSLNNFRIGGGVCMVALLWSLWLARNEMTFKGTNINMNTLNLLIKQRSFAWSISANLLVPEHANIWAAKPQTAYRIRARWELKNLLHYRFQTSGLVGFIDAAWKKDGKNSHIGGIGGFLIDNMGSILFTFSGPCNKITVYEAESEALEYMVLNIKVKGLNPGTITICTDSLKLANDIRFCKTGINIGGVDMGYFCISNNIQVTYIRRDVNYEADRLSKEGANRSHFVAGWTI